MAHYWKIKDKNKKIDYTPKYCIPLGSTSDFLCLPDKTNFKKVFEGGYSYTREELNDYEFILIGTSVNGVETLDSFAKYYEKALGETLRNTKSGKMNMQALKFNTSLVSRFKANAKQIKK